MGGKGRRKRLARQHRGDTNKKAQHENQEEIGKLGGKIGGAATTEKKKKNGRGPTAARVCEGNFGEHGIKRQTRR